MRTKGSTNFVRRNLMLSEQSASRLDSLRTQTEAQSDSEVVRDALRLYEQLVADLKLGKKLVLRDVNGNDEVVRAFL